MLVEVLDLNLRLGLAVQQVEGVLQLVAVDGDTHSCSGPTRATSARLIALIPGQTAQQPYAPIRALLGYGGLQESVHGPTLHGVTDDAVLRPSLHMPPMESDCRRCKLANRCAPRPVP